MKYTGNSIVSGSLKQGSNKVAALRTYSQLLGKLGVVKKPGSSITNASTGSNATRKTSGQLFPLGIGR